MSLPGMVVTIRLNPRDCLSILDLAEKMGYRNPALSFAQLTSTGLGVLLETARQGGMLPEPDEFQYLNRTAGYTSSRGKAKARMANDLLRAGAELRSPVMRPPAEEAQPAQTPNPPMTLAAPSEVRQAAPGVEPEELRYAQQRMTELLTKQDAVQDGIQGITWTDKDQEEFDTYYKLLYPD